MWQGTAKGPILRRDLLSAGMLPEDIDKAVRRGLLVVPQRGVLWGGARPQTPWDRATSTLASCSVSDAVVSHETAARIYGIDVPDAGPEHLTIRRNSRRRNRSSLRWHTGGLDPVDIQDIDGIPVTTPARTLIDLACRGPRMTSVWRMDDAIRRGITNQAAILDATTRCGYVPGIRRAVRFAKSTDGGSQSPIETEGRLVLIDAGMPPPETQVKVRRDDGHFAFIDLGYRKQHLGIELDGRDVHESPEALYRDRYRQNDVGVEGWFLMRFAPVDVRFRRHAYVSSVRRNYLARS